MSLFQIIADIILCLLLVNELFHMRKSSNRPRAVLRSVVWVTAAIAISFPNIVQLVASTIGIDRGADLVSYFFILAFIGTTFYFYSRYLRLQRQITDIVRHLAIKEK